MKVEDITKKREGIHKVLDITMSKEEATLLDEFWALIPKQFSSGKDLPKGYDVFYAILLKLLDEN